MNFELTDDQRAFQDMARGFAAAEMAPHAAAWDEKAVFPVEALRKAAALGFGGFYCSEKYGGSALSRFDAAVIFEELSAGCVSDRSEESRVGQTGRSAGSIRGSP